MLRSIRALEEEAAEEVQKIKSESVADDMMDSCHIAVQKATEDAAQARQMLLETVSELEKHRNTALALLKHVAAQKLEREQLQAQVQAQAEMQAEMMAAVVESAALKAELDQVKSSQRSYRLRYAATCAKLEGMEQQIKVLRDEEDENEAAQAAHDKDAAKRAEENAKAAKLIDGDPAFLLEEVVRFFAMEVDVDKTKGQRNKAQEQAALADARALAVQEQMIESCAAACLIRLVADVELEAAKDVVAVAQRAEEAAINNAAELQNEASQLQEMLEDQEDTSARLQAELEDQIGDKEYIMADMGRREAALVALQDQVSSKEDGAIELRMEIEELAAKLKEGRAREDALRRGMQDLGSTRLVDYIMSRADLCPAENFKLSVVRRPCPPPAPHPTLSRTIRRQVAP
jgi:hypothetical protein